MKKVKKFSEDQILFLILEEYNAVTQSSIKHGVHDPLRVEK